MNDDSIGDRIRGVRGRFSRAEFASQVDIGTATLARYESGERSPDAEFLVKICDTYKVSANWLLFGKEDLAGDLDNNEKVLLDGFRSFDADTKKRILAFVLMGSDSLINVPVAPNNDRQVTKIRGNNVSVGDGNRGSIAGGDMTKTKKMK